MQSSDFGVSPFRIEWFICLRPRIHGPKVRRRYGPGRLSSCSLRTSQIAQRALFDSWLFVCAVFGLRDGAIVQRKAILSVTKVNLAERITSIVIPRQSRSIVLRFFLKGDCVRRNNRDYPPVLQKSQVYVSGTAPFQLISSRSKNLSVQGCIL